LLALPRKRRSAEPGHGRERDRLLALSPSSGRLPGRRGFLTATTALLTVLLLVGAGLTRVESIAPRLLVGSAAVAIGVLLLLLLARRSAAPARDLLQDNVASLERTNRELVEARAETVRAARLASVGTLAAGIAHEVGNPLGAVIAYVDVARARARRGDTNVEILDSIREEAERIHRIVRGLLDYARPGEQEVGPRAPAEVVHRVRELLEHQGRFLGVETRWEVSPDTPLVTMDPHRLEQVLVNLILNALDAMSDVEPRRLSLRV
jgi:C4-dicarboxylate-specific signal transduction histidine kinase